MYKVLASIGTRDEELRLGAESLGKYGKKLGGYRDGLLRTSEPHPLPSGRRARLCLGTDRDRSQDLQQASHQPWPHPQDAQVAVVDAAAPGDPCWPPPG